MNLAVLAKLWAERRAGEILEIDHSAPELSGQRAGRGGEPPGAAARLALCCVAGGGGGTF